MKKTLFSLMLASAFFAGSVALADAPVAPVSLIATATSPTNINVAWSASTGAVGYQIFRNATATPIATTSNTSYTDSGLVPNTAYTYWVTAYDASSTVSALSTSTSATTPTDITAPSAPTNLVALPASVSQINLSWSAASDNVGVTGYVVYRNGSPLATTTLLSYNDTGLASTTTYIYNVLAFDAARNYSALSANASAQPQNDVTAPSVPTNLSAAVISSSQINLSWTAATDNFGVAGYRIYRNGSLVNSTTTNSFANTGLVASTTYAYQVSAIDATGNESATSTTVTATTLGQSSSTGGTVTISIKNGGKNNKLINLNSNEIIKVVVYSNDSFKARDIVNSSVRFGGAKAISWNLGFANRDRKLDREYNFRAKQMTDLSNTDTVAIFTAKLKNGQSISGQASVRVINSKKVKKMPKIEPYKGMLGDIKFKNLFNGLNLHIASTSWATTTLYKAKVENKGQVIKKSGFSASSSFIKIIKGNNGQPGNKGGNSNKHK